jgi:hypothetical protein
VQYNKPSHSITVDICTSIGRQSTPTITLLLVICFRLWPCTRVHFTVQNHCSKLGGTCQVGYSGRQYAPCTETLHPCLFCFYFGIMPSARSGQVPGLCSSFLSLAAFLYQHHTSKRLSCSLPYGDCCTWTLRAGPLSNSQSPVRHLFVMQSCQGEFHRHSFTGSGGFPFP